MDSLIPSREVLGDDQRYNWVLPLTRPTPVTSAVNSVWYVGLPLSSAHRGSHSGGGEIIAGVEGQEKYQNEGTVYPHASLMEMITYHDLCFPDIKWTYLDLSHEFWDEIQERIRDDPPDVVAFSVYTATYVWALIVAAAVKASNPKSIVIFGNDHSSLLRSKILTGKYGREVVDFIGLGNNGPFTMMNLLYCLRGQIDLDRVPSLCYARNGELVEQPAPTYPLNRRRLPDYRLILEYLSNHYDNAFRTWYGEHYDLKRMITLAIDGGCTWGAHPKRRCKHCSIQGLTPKFADLDQIVTTLESVVGELSSNVYAAGDSTLGFSSNQWRGQSSFLDQLAERCAASPVLSRQRFLLAYGLVPEFLNSAELSRGFVRTWNVGVEAFDPQLLKADSKGVNKGTEQVIEAFELARQLDYRIYVSGILGLPGTTMSKLRREVEQWLALVDAFGDIITTVSRVAAGDHSRFAHVLGSDHRGRAYA